jgi:hemerythrin HHE cation binding domain-containing protein
MAPTTPTRPAPRRRRRRARRSSIAGTGGGRRNVGLGGPGGEARPSPGTSPVGAPDLRGGADRTMTTGPISDALERLQAEHRELAALLMRSSRALPRVERVLRKHTRLEEEIFYPALRSAAGREFEPVLSEAMRQHRAIGAALAKLRGADAAAHRRQYWDELRECVQAHVRQEEGPLFAEALRRLSRPERLWLGERMDLLAQRY